MTAVNAERGGFLASMPGYGAGLGLGVKLVSVFPENLASGLPSHQALIVIFDPATVIDRATNVAYLFSKTYASGTSGPAAWYAHAIDVASGIEQPGFPIVVQGTASNDASQSFDDEPDFSFETVSTDDPDNAGLTYLEVTVKWKDRDQNEDRTYRLTRLMRDKTSTAAATTPSNP